MILAEELNEVLAKKISNFDEEDAGKIVKEVDHNLNGMINYSEFLAATINVRTFFTEEE